MTPPDHARVAGTASQLDGGDVLPDLRVEVSEIFSR